MQYQTCDDMRYYLNVISSNNIACLQTDIHRGIPQCYVSVMVYPQGGIHKALSTVLHAISTVLAHPSRLWYIHHVISRAMYLTRYITCAIFNLVCRLRYVLCHVIYIYIYIYIYISHVIFHVCHIPRAICQVVLRWSINANNLSVIVALMPQAATRWRQ